MKSPDLNHLWIRHSNAVSVTMSGKGNQKTLEYFFSPFNSIIFTSVGNFPCFFNPEEKQNGTKLFPPWGKIALEGQRQKLFMPV